MAVHPPPSLELFGQACRDAADRIGAGYTQPDDDWKATLTMENAEREMQLMALSPGLFVPESIDGGFAKNTLVELLSMSLRAFKAVRYGLLLNTWQVKAEDDPSAEAWSGALHEHPLRTEVLLLLLADRERGEVWMTDIVRSTDRPPTLTPWVNMSAGENKTTSYTGRFVSLRDALLEDEQ
jgi:hypothetical protein